MNIRFANENDIPRMIDLLVQVGLVHHNIRPDIFRGNAQKYDENMLKEILNDKNRPIFCCDIDGKMVGYAFCIIKNTKNDSVLNDELTLYIDDLCVDESVRGKGYAKLIFEAVLAYAKEINCNNITLNVWNGNDTAIKFYEKCGFKTRKIFMEYKI